MGVVESVLFHRMGATWADGARNKLVRARCNRIHNLHRPSPFTRVKPYLGDARLSGGDHRLLDLHVRM